MRIEYSNESEKKKLDKIEKKEQIREKISELADPSTHENVKLIQVNGSFLFGSN